VQSAADGLFDKRYSDGQNPAFDGRPARRKGPFGNAGWEVSDVQV
jgi:hypothetical protein